ncbi:MAG: hypothetical protein IT379_42500 [Deltaproteobacteria bacterium]|nr:hypothetical protein [Deltaproteobacteria bacterium]
MADAPKKPRDIKDLKARLGRTIAPGTAVPGMPTPAAPPVAANPAGMPVTGAAPAGTPTPAAPPPAAVVAPPVLPGVPPPAIGPMPAFGPAVPPPPFAPPQAPPKPRSNDPFAAQAAAPAGPREVRLVIDEKPVADSEVGRKRGVAFYVAIAGVLIVGLLIGFGGGSILGDRKQYNYAVRDGGEVFRAVQTSASTLGKVRNSLDQIIAKAARTEVDVDSTQSLRAQKVPLDASSFSRRRYSNFKASTVDDLFDYYNNIQLIWSRIESHAAITLRDREAIQTAGTRTGQVATARYGCFAMPAEGVGVMCALVTVDGFNPQTNPQTKQLILPEKVRIRAGNTPPQERPLFVNTQGQAVANSVVLVDNQSSMSVLGESAGPFQDYVRRVRELKQLVDRTTETQTRLIRALQEIAQLEQVFPTLPEGGE